MINPFTGLPSVEKQLTDKDRTSLLDDKEWIFDLALKLNITQGGGTGGDSFWSSQNSGIHYSGHIAVGDGVVDTIPSLSQLSGTVSATIMNEDAFTDGSLGLNATIVNAMSVNATAHNSGSWLAQDGLIEVESGNDKNYLGLVAADGGAVYHNGTGIVSMANGIIAINENISSGTMSNSINVRALSLHTGSGPVTQQANFYGGHIVLNGTNTITTSYGVLIDTPVNVGGTFTTVYGIRVATQDVGTTAYGLVLGDATTNTLWVNDTNNSTDAAGGIVFGSSKDTNLYRSAASTLKTDDAFIAATGIESTPIKPRVVSVSDATSITPNNDTSDIVTQANTQAAGTLTINAPSGTAYSGQELTIRIKSTNVQTFSFNSIYRGSTDTPLPVSTYASSTTIYMKFIYNSADTKWDMVSVTDGY